MSKRAEEYAVKIHDTAIKEGEKYANSHGKSIIEEICYGRGFKAGCIQGYEQAEKDILSKITKEHLEGLKWIERTGITSQPYPYHKYCKDLRITLEKLLSDE